MFDILTHRSFARLYMAQIFSLLGTGLLTVALALLAFNLAGEKAASVLGTAFAIKMIAYIVLAPVANAVVRKLPRRAVLIGADFVRAGIVLLLPFVESVWQVYLLVFVLQAASATFTPTFQSVIPDILTDEKDYTKALSLSRLAYDLENLLSPLVAGILLAVVSFDWLFGGTAIGFMCSAILVYSTTIPTIISGGKDKPFLDRLTRGSRIYLSTPRLRGLLSVNLSAASAGAFVIVNTVVIVRTIYDGSENSVAIALAAFGGGSMISALCLPSILEHYSDRGIMTYSAVLISAILLFTGIFQLHSGYPGWYTLLAIWFVTGILYSAILTPSGRLLRRSAQKEDRPTVFTAHFALSHACWLITYPLAGWFGDLLGIGMVMIILGLLSLLGAVNALRVWPVQDPDKLFHEHPDLSESHPHFRGLEIKDGRLGHSHRFVIDDEHRVWPTHG